MIFTPYSLFELLTLGLKYKLVTQTFGGASHPLISDAHAQRAHPVPARTFSARIGSRRSLSACVSSLRA
jgi:hypothetical protein